VPFVHVEKAVTNRLSCGLALDVPILQRETCWRGKGKVVPLRSIEAHLEERRYSCYSSLTSAVEGGEWSASHPGRALPPGKEPPVPIVQVAGWAPEPAGSVAKLVVVKLYYIRIKYLLLYFLKLRLCILKECFK
jgi:hypothetical protein